MAKAAAPYRHPQLSAIKHGGDENPLDHVIRIIWKGMPPISDERSDIRIQAGGSIPALPPPQAEVVDNCSASPGGKDGSDDQ